jgi:hypothetical protein
MERELECGRGTAETATKNVARRRNDHGLDVSKAKTRPEQERVRHDLIDRAGWCDRARRLTENLYPVEARGRVEPADGDRVGVGGGGE